MTQLHIDFSDCKYQAPAKWVSIAGITEMPSIKKETEKAVLLDFNHAKHTCWVPKSVLTVIDTRYMQNGDSALIAKCQLWYVKKYLNHLL